MTGEYQTPTWACELLVERYFRDLKSSDRVIEPSCGEGHWLDAIPRSVPAIGIELNPTLAARARDRTGREIIVGDVLDVQLAAGSATAVIGNPPFTARLIDGILDRAHGWLVDGGRCGLVLPACILYRERRIARERERWAIEQEALPREIWQRLYTPLVFARFTKSRSRTLVGFALFDEMTFVRAMTNRTRAMLSAGRSPVWRDVVLDALRQCGGEADLAAIYSRIAKRRPTANPFWKEKVRQQLQRHAVRVSPGVYRMAA